MSKRHDERYKAAVERISEARRNKIAGRAALELDLDPDSEMLFQDQERLERLINHKLGLRVPHG